MAGGVGVVGFPTAKLGVMGLLPKPGVMGLKPNRVCFVSGEIGCAVASDGGAHKRRGVSD